MEGFLRFLSGYVLISVEGEQTERFLNLCRGRGILIRELRYLCGNKIAFMLSVQDYFKLKPLRSKAKVHICVVEKHGLPFFFYRNKKRKAFFLGIILCFCLMTLLSCRIWNIHIEGNVKNSTPELLGFLEQKGIVHGIPKSQLNCSEIAAMVRENYPEITWVSAKIQGTKLILTVQEGKMLQQAEKKEDVPCDITADMEGTIVKMVTRAGLPLFKPGDTCKKGDILVQGRLDILNDSQEAIRYEYVRADADIYVRHTISYYYEFPLAYEKEIPTGNTQKSFSLKLGSFFADFSEKEREHWRTERETLPWRITENFNLPICLGRNTSREYRNVSAVRTEKQARQAASERLQLYEENLMEKGVQIFENNVKIEVNTTACVSSGTLQVIEKTGEETALQRLEQPEERTAEDGQQYN